MSRKLTLWDDEIKLERILKKHSNTGVICELWAEDHGGAFPFFCYVGDVYSEWEEDSSMAFYASVTVVGWINAKATITLYFPLQGDYPKIIEQ